VCVDISCSAAEDGQVQQTQGSPPRRKPTTCPKMRHRWLALSWAARAIGKRSFGVAHEREIVSAHRTPEWMAEYAGSAEERGLEVIVAGAGGAAHLPGMVAAITLLPVLGVPVRSRALQGLDSLLSIVQMPGGVPVGTMAIGTAGAKNAGLLAVRILAGSRPELRDKLRTYHRQQADEVRSQTLP